MEGRGPAFKRQPRNMQSLLSSCAVGRLGRSGRTYRLWNESGQVTRRGHVFRLTLRVGGSKVAIPAEQQRIVVLSSQTCPPARGGCSCPLSLPPGLQTRASTGFLCRTIPEETCFLDCLALLACTTSEGATGTRGTRGRGGGEEEGTEEQHKEGDKGVMCAGLCGEFGPSKARAAGYGGQRYGGQVGCVTGLGPSLRSVAVTRYITRGR